MDKREEYFVECEFKSDGGDCDKCGSDKKGSRIWFEPTSYEYPDEGNYYCDECAVKEIEEAKAFDNLWFGKEKK